MNIELGISLVMQTDWTLFAKIPMYSFFIVGVLEMSLIIRDYNGQY